MIGHADGRGSVAPGTHDATPMARLVAEVRAGRERPHDAQRYLNRELSWLDFNERVLALAEDAATPILERAKFLAIFGANLDEFFQVRVAGLMRQEAAGVNVRSEDGLTASEQLCRIAIRVSDLAERHALLFGRVVRPRLARESVRFARWRQLAPEAQAELRSTFVEHVFPVLTPLAVDPGHPFPYISDLSLNLAVMLRDPASGRQHSARIKVPPLLPRFVATADEGILVPLEELIAANLSLLFPGMTTLEQHTFRVTRNADLELDDDEADDLLEALEEELRRRRLAPAVRLEVDRRMSRNVLALLMRELQVTDREVYRLPGPLGLADLWQIHAALDRPDLKYQPFSPATPARLTPDEDGNVDLFRVLREGDLLVHHPYDSFGTTVQAFIEQAAADPSVLAIKQTLYRTSGESPIVDALVSAAAAGKQVVVLVEIKARFDEQNNITWARTLERAGCHVVYGLVGLKTHCKLCLVVRQEPGGLRRYVHVGTGNYNPTTARIYEDLGLLTANEGLGEDVSHLFNLLTGHSRRSDYDSIIVAPLNLRRRVIELIRREAAAAAAGDAARIVMKLNSLVDEAVIDALYEASEAGVEIEILVRGSCSLRPGVAGQSTRIRVRSILGRFLEHSRVYLFGAEDPQIWIGSADMMHRNLDRRVEAIVRVDDPTSRERLRAILDLALTDTVGTWTLDAEGAWHRAPAGRHPVSVQATLLARARG